MKESRYLIFTEIPNALRKTKTIQVDSRHRGDRLGTIRWYGPWRQYTFWPQAGCIFNRECLREIIDYCDDLMRARRAVDH